nr:protein TAPETUM DETERMINANT 1-like [Ipomoea batatas]
MCNTVALESSSVNFDLPNVDHASNTSVGNGSTGGFQFYREVAKKPKLNWVCDFGLQWSKTGACTNKDISISQSTYSTTGIPQYVVEIVNTCFSGCAPSKIHLHCDWFASARIVNPNTFKRLSYDDCLVNEGKPLKASQMIRFTYSNTFMYPLAFKSAKFC